MPPVGGTRGHPAQACPCTRDTAPPPTAGGVMQQLALEGQPPHADNSVRASGAGVERALAHRAHNTLLIPDPCTPTNTPDPIPEATLPRAVLEYREY